VIHDSYEIQNSTFLKFSAMMRTLLLLVPLLVAVQSEGECDGVKEDFNQCTRKAHETYITAMKPVSDGRPNYRHVCIFSSCGERVSDGRPNYRARKTCNYMMEAIEGCGNKLMQHGCKSEEEVIAMKDFQLGKVLEVIKSSIAEWDSCKCPPMKAHIDRMKAKDGYEVKGCSPHYAIVREEFHEPETTSQFMDLDFAFIAFRPRILQALCLF